MGYTLDTEVLNAVLNQVICVVNVKEGCLTQLQHRSFQYSLRRSTENRANPPPLEP